MWHRVKSYVGGNVVGYVAIFLALSGSVYAAGKIDGKQFKPNSIPGNRIERSTLTGAQIKPNSVPGNRIKNGTLTGAQINSATLGTVANAQQAKSADSATNAQHANSADSATNAQHADSATNATTAGGLSVVEFSHSGHVPSSSPVRVLDLAGLRLDYACDAITGVSLNATTTANGSEIWLARNFPGGATEENAAPFNTGDTFHIGGFVGTGVYTGPGGQVVTFTYRNTTTTACDGVAGTAYGR